MITVFTCWDCHKIFSVKPEKCPSCGGRIAYYETYDGNPDINYNWPNITLSTTNDKDVILGTDTLSGNTLSLTEKDRPYGLVLIGQVGMGKTNVLEQLIIQDLKNGVSSFVFAPHEELSERLLRLSIPIRPDGILFCEVTDDLSYGFNPLEITDPRKSIEVGRTIDSLMEVFRKHWGKNDVFMANVEWIMPACMRTILYNPGNTFAEIPKLFLNDEFLSKLLANVQHVQTQQFWAEYRNLTRNKNRPQDRWQLIHSTVTRLSQFLGNEWLARILYQAKSTIRFDELIGSGKTVVFPLSVGRLGREPASLLGSLLINKLATTLLNRFENKEWGKELTPVRIYIDEYSLFSTPVMTETLFAQARKFGVSAAITLHSLSEIEQAKDRAAVLNASPICFQLVGEDAKTLAAQMPLPDPAGLMKPEPILVYSPQPVNDIWHRGHPNQIVMSVQKRYFWIVDA